VLAAHPDVRFLALSVSDAADDVIAVIRAGARGYVTKTISGPELPRPSGAWRMATPSSRRSWPGSYSTPSPRQPPGAIDPELDQLTAREREVLRHIARGYAYKEIARELSISV